MGLVILVVFLCFSSAAVVSGHTFHSYSHQQPIDVSIDLSKEPWFSKYGSQEDLDFSGHLSFSHLPASKCLEDNSTLFDIAVLGFPFDETVSYRPGARFGPFSIRSGSRRQRTNFWDLTWGKSPSNWGAGMVDCGDAPISAYDNSVAIDQMEAAYDTLISRPVLGGVSSAYTNTTSAFAKDGIEHPRIVTLGGDHTIVLPILRSLYKVYGPVSVIHFDAHQDTGAVEGRKDQERITHGSYFSIAAEEKLMTNTSVHGGIRQKMGGISQVIHDEAVGFITISSEDIDDYGIHNVIKKIRERVGDTPVYLSLDIDTVDPSLAPATGTPEIGGWTTREMKRILRGLAGLNFVGADIVEVAPAYDHGAFSNIYLFISNGPS
ncbi:Arginase/deacetylase [Gymnopus androsaceus JB14]|uniref:Arginase/deacetylase n=1 Tax=Gymnopus androsaceus JB14 TaxID=1447944 RepID=A0A6A4IFA4_9AGAR|nr:Arginase/deacetylase [Gymnopus androsaceus JB14]